MDLFSNYGAFLCMDVQPDPEPLPPQLAHIFFGSRAEAEVVGKVCSEPGYEVGVAIIPGRYVLKLKA